MDYPPQLRRAYALLWVTGIVGVTFLLSIAALDFMHSHRSMTRKAETSARALEASRAGLSLAIAHLRVDPGWQEGFDGLELVSDTRCSLQFSGPERSRHSHEPGARPLPPASVLLVSRGQSGPEVVYSEAVVTLNTTLLENDFNLDANEWQQSSNLPVVALGHYVLDLGVPLTSMAGDEAWSDYQADFEVLVPQGTGLGFLVRASGPAHSITGYLIDYQFLDDPLRGGSFRLFRLEDGHQTELARVSQSLGIAWLLGLKHQYQIRVQGGDLRFAVDGETILEFRDPNPIRQGRIGLRPLLGTVVLVDRVRVQSLFQVVSQWRR